MTFPDKTGTGDLRLDINNIQAPVLGTLPFTELGNQDGVKTNKTDTFQFPQNKVTKTAIKFPTIYQENLVGNIGNQKQATRFKFPLAGDKEPDRKYWNE